MKQIHDRLVNELTEKLYERMHPIDEMASVIRKSVQIYYVQPSKLGKERRKKINDFFVRRYKGSEELTDKQILSKLEGRIFARQHVEGEEIKFTFYITKGKYKDGVAKATGINIGKIKNPSFIRPDAAFAIDTDIIDLKGVLPGDTVTYFKTGRDAQAIEQEYIDSYNEQLQSQGFGQEVDGVLINSIKFMGKRFENVAKFIKKPGNVNSAGADFVMLGLDGKVIEGSNISHKHTDFKSYGGIKKKSDTTEDELLKKELVSFMKDCTRIWDDAIMSDKKFSSIGMKRNISKDTARKILYKNDIDYLVIGRLNFKYNPKEKCVDITGENSYKSPDLPDGKYLPILKSDKGAGGSPISKAIQSLYFDYPELVDGFGATTNEYLKELIKDRGMVPIVDKKTIPEIEGGVVVGAKLVVRYECVPGYKASSKKYKSI